MSEGMATRVGRIISGSLNTLVDAVENSAPEIVMEQAIREVDTAIDDVRAELGKTVANKHLANTRLMGENQKHETLAEQIQIAVEEGRNDLAEAAISRQLDIEAQLPVLENAITVAGEEEKELEGYIHALQAKKREMQSDLLSYRDSRSHSITDDNSANSDVANRVSKADATFERVMSNQTRIPVSRIADERKRAVQLAELEELARQNRIKERLAQIKSKVNSL